VRSTRDQHLEGAYRELAAGAASRRRGRNGRAVGRGVGGRVTAEWMRGGLGRRKANSPATVPGRYSRGRRGNKAGVARGDEGASPSSVLAIGGGVSPRHDWGGRARSDSSWGRSVPVRADCRRPTDCSSSLQLLVGVGQLGRSLAESRGACGSGGPACVGRGPGCWFS